MPSKPLRPWRTLSRSTVYHPNRFLKVELHSVELPDGQVIPDWSWLEIPSASIMLAVTEEGQFVCMRQIKYALDGACLGLVGGMLEADEDPLEAARRELLEETGYSAPEWVPLGSYIVDPNRGICTMHLYLALGAKYVMEPNSGDLEDQEVVLLSRAELETAYRSGEFKILSWGTVIAMSLLYLDNKAKG